MRGKRGLSISMPWLAGTALLHFAVVMEKRGALKV